MVRDWQREVLELVRAEAGNKQFVARAGAIAVNGLGLVVMIAVFSATAFIPTGAEIVVAGGTTIAAQKVLEAIFGDQAIRSLAEQARHRLLERVGALLTTDAGRFHAVCQRPAGRSRGPGRAPAGRRRPALRPVVVGAAAVTDTLPERVVALDHFVSLTAPHLPPAMLEPARRAVAQAGSRLALSRHHTVVALAGATGSGKSSLFNELAGSTLSRCRVAPADDRGGPRQCVGLGRQRRSPARLAGCGPALRTPRRR